MKVLYSENYETQMKKIEGISPRERYIVLMDWKNIVKILHKAMYRFSVIPIKMPVAFARELGQIHSFVGLYK